MSTEQQGPFFIERNVDTIVVRSKQLFTCMVVRKLKAEQQAAIYALPPMPMDKNTMLVLSAKGCDDVIVKPEGEV